MAETEALKKQAFRGPGGRLTINLSDKGLKKIPDALWEVEDLECIILDNNDIKSIPPEIA